MTFLAQFFLTAVTALIMENAVFARALGASRSRAIIRRKTIVPFGLTLTAMTTVSSIAVWLIHTFLVKEHAVSSMLRPLLYTATITVVYLIVLLAGKHLFFKLYRKVGRMLPYATFNCALFGAIYLAMDQNYTFAKTLGFGVGSGLGFILATLLIEQGQRRMELCDVPKAFKGYPAMLLYVGIISLALYGLVGHQLPF